MSEPRVNGTRPRRAPARAPWSSKFEKTLHRNPYFGVLRQRVRLPDGTLAKYFTLDFPGPAVGIVAVHKGRVLLLRQYRFIVGEYVWAIPSGGVHPNETAIAAAARELEEESGYRATRLRPLQSFYASYGCSNQVFQIFLAEGLARSGNAFDRNEVMKVRWFSRRELLALIARNGVVDGLSLAPLLLVLLQRSPSTPRVRSRELKPPRGAF